MLNERQHRILAALSHADAPITGQQLAELMDVSIRTVQGEISRINRIASLVESSNRGYTVNRKALAALEGTEGWQRDSSIAHNVLQALLFGGKQRGADLAEMLYVSSATLDRHMKELLPLLKPYGLEINRGGGWIWIEGDEVRKRQLIGSLVAQETDGVLATTDTSETVFGTMDSEVVHAIVTSTIESFGYRIRPGFEKNLMGSITIALYRMRSDALLQEQDEASHVKDDERVEYQVAEELCKRYSIHLDITPNYSEQTYLAHLLRGQIELAENSFDACEFHVVQSEFIQEIEKIVEEVFGMFCLRVASAQSLYNFAMHVDALMFRTEENQVRSVEVLENVKRHMPFVYEIALLVSSRISQHFDIRISEGEVGFICIHMGMILHSTMDQEHVSIGLICQDYHGISKTIRSGICAHFSDTVRIYDFDIPASKKGVRQLPVDLIVTTQHAPDYNQKTVEVSPFLSPSDLMRIERAVNEVLEQKNIERTRCLIGRHLDDRLFFRTNDVPTKNEAIAFLGDKLREFGVVDDSFTQSVLERETISSTCFFDLFAIPHALEMNSKRTLMAILVSENGVEWDSSNIHVVLMIAVNKNDRKEFVELYNRIVKQLCSGIQMSKVIQSSNVEEFMDHLSLARS